MLVFHLTNQTKTKQKTKKLKITDGASLWPVRSRELPVLSIPVLSQYWVYRPVPLCPALSGCWTLNSGPYDVKASTSPAEPSPQPQPLYFQWQLLLSAGPVFTLNNNVHILEYMPHCAGYLPNHSLALLLFLNFTQVDAVCI